MTLTRLNKRILSSKCAANNLIATFYHEISLPERAIVPNISIRGWNNEWTSKECANPHLKAKDATAEEAKN
jgi:hypothetical protein